MLYQFYSLLARQMLNVPEVAFCNMPILSDSESCWRLRLMFLNSLIWFYASNPLRRCKITKNRAKYTNFPQIIVPLQQEIKKETILKQIIIAITALMTLLSCGGQKENSDVYST